MDDPTIRNMSGLSRSTFQREEAEGGEKRKRIKRDREKGNFIMVQYTSSLNMIHQ